MQYSVWKDNIYFLRQGYISDIRLNNKYILKTCKVQFCFIDHIWIYIYSINCSFGYYLLSQYLRDSSCSTPGIHDDLIGWIPFYSINQILAPPLLQTMTPHHISVRPIDEYSSRLNFSSWRWIINMSQNLNFLFDRLEQMLEWSYYLVILSVSKSSCDKISNCQGIVRAWINDIHYDASIWSLKIYSIPYNLYIRTSGRSYSTW